MVGTQPGGRAPKFSSVAILVSDGKGKDKPKADKAKDKGKKDDKKDSSGG